MWRQNENQIERRSKLSDFLSTEYWKGCILEFFRKFFVYPPQKQVVGKMDTFVDFQCFESHNDHTWHDHNQAILSSDWMMYKLNIPNHVTVDQVVIGQKIEVHHRRSCHIFLGLFSASLKWLHWKIQSWWKIQNSFRDSRNVPSIDHPASGWK